MPAMPRRSSTWRGATNTTRPIVHPLWMVSSEGAPIVLDGDALRIVRRAPLAHVGVQGAKGPHVTPQGFVWFRDRMWLLTPRDSFKAKVLLKRPEAGALLEHEGSFVDLSGRVSVLDPLDPSSLFTDPAASALLGVAFAAYLKKNAYESMAAARRRFGLDVLGLPMTRVAIVITPRRSALFGSDGSLEAAGDWRNRADDDVRVTDAAAADLDDLPDEFKDMAVRGKHLAVVGWGGSGAPLVIPGRWDAVQARAEVDAQLLDLAMAPSQAEACITIDNEIGPGLEAKRGVVLRGPGVATFRDGKASISLDVTKVHVFEGTKASTLTAEVD